MNQCFYCGRLGAMTKDHVIPRTRGGVDGPGNEVLACRPCNSSKGNFTLEEWRQSKRLKIARDEHGVPILSRTAIKWLAGKGIDVLEGVRPVRFWFELTGRELPSVRKEAA